MAARTAIKLTASFERNLDEIEVFLTEAEAPQAFDALLDELTEIGIPNLERFPGMGRLFLQRPVRSVEAANGIDRLRRQLGAFARDGELQEYVMTHYCGCTRESAPLSISCRSGISGNSRSIFRRRGQTDWHRQQDAFAAANSTGPRHSPRHTPMSRAVTTSS